MTEYTTEQNQELIEAIKRPVRYYRVCINGYGGEAAYINIDKASYDFWKNVTEENGDTDLVGYMLAEDGDYDDLEIVIPPEAMFMNDEDGDHRPWYEHHNEYVHQYGVEYGSAYLYVDEVDSDDYMSNSIKEVVEGENLQDYLDGIMEANDYEFDLVEADEDMDGEGEYVLQMYSSEKGQFFDGIVETTGNFDPKKLKITYTEYPNGEDVITLVEYDGVEIDNNGGDTNGKGYSAHLWKNE
jgi:hypothetical protein